MLRALRRAWWCARRRWRQRFGSCAGGGEGGSGGGSGGSGGAGAAAAAAELADARDMRLAFEAKFHGARRRCEALEAELGAAKGAAAAL